MSGKIKPVQSLKHVEVADLFHHFADALNRPEVVERLREEDPGRVGLSNLTQAMCWFMRFKAGVDLVRESRPAPVSVDGKQ